MTNGTYVTHAWVTGLTSVYTPGYSGLPHPFPQDTTPARKYLLLDDGHARGPPESACEERDIKDNKEIKRNTFLWEF